MLHLVVVMMLASVSVGGSVTPNLPEGLPILSSASLGDGVIVVGTASDGVVLSEDGGESFTQAPGTPASLLVPDRPAAITTLQVLDGA